MRSSVLGAVAAIAIITGACSSATADNTGAEFSFSEALNAQSAEAVEGEEIDAPPEVLGAPLNPFDLRAGMCFNEGSWYDEERDRRIELTASVDCSQTHAKEVFHEADFPAPAGAPFPGEAKMTEWSTELCYQAFSDFVGLEYELSSYEIGFLQPTEATFEHPVGRHRRVTCTLFDLTGETKVGSAEGTGL